MSDTKADRIEVTEEEDKAMVNVLDAVMTGMSMVAGNYVEDRDGQLYMPPVADAGMKRLQKILDAINSIYPPAMVDAWMERACGLA
jgi:hypothetical protein